MQEKLKSKKKMNTTQVIALGFLLTILCGTLLLMLPISHASETIAPIDALFTAVTSVCVTGLTTVTVAEQFSLFGHIVILVLIQIGGLGIISITSGMWLILRRRFTLSDSVLLEDALNLSTLHDLPVFLKRVFKYTAFIEFACFLLYLPVFIGQYGLRGIWISLFHSISTFCNAGIDIIGGSSLTAYRSDVWMNLVTMSEIILGGLGFVVYFDLWERIRTLDFRRTVWHGKAFRLSLHTRIVLFSTLALILIGAAGVAVFEWSNPKTLGLLSPAERILASLFQSVSCRTAGFATISQSGLLPGSVFLCCMLMFIGGSPIGTAGGIKTTTAAILLLSTYHTLRGQSDSVVFKRRIPARTVKKATAVFVVALSAAAVFTLALMKMTGGSSSDVMFEVFSALGTVGLTRDFTSSLGMLGKILIMVCMYLGRIGPVSLVMLVSGKVKSQSLRYAEENVTVG